MSELPQRLVFFAAAAAAGFPLCLLLPHLLRALGLEKTNFQGRRIASGGGLLFLLGALPCLSLSPAPANRLLVLAAAGFGLLGLVDDRWGTAEHKGLRGHLTALAGGRVTTGFIKASGGLLLAATLAWALHPSPAAAMSALLIALAANLFNLLDLRPLRALKAFWAFGLLLCFSAPPVLPVLLGLSFPYARLEARRTVMLGDTGANALGGVLGVTAATLLPGWEQLLLVMALALFHLWAERYSLSAWIEARPWARAVDGWGWRDDEG